MARSAFVVAELAFAVVSEVFVASRFVFNVTACSVAVLRCLVTLLVPGYMGP